MPCHRHVIFIVGMHKIFLLYGWYGIPGLLSKISTGKRGKGWNGPNEFGKCWQFAPSCGDPSTCTDTGCSAGTCDYQAARAACEGLKPKGKVSEKKERTNKNIFFKKCTFLRNPNCMNRLLEPRPAPSWITSKMWCLTTTGYFYSDIFQLNDRICETACYFHAIRFGLGQRGQVALLHQLAPPGNTRRDRVLSQITMSVKK